MGWRPHILLSSATAYSNNSSPDGLASLADASGGPDPAEAAELHGVDHRSLADREGIGTDRTSSGTDELAGYPDSFATTLADMAKCPDEWLFAVHRVPLTARLNGGKTAAQTFYDAHFAGAAQAANAMDSWEGTRSLVDEPRYAIVHAALEEAAHQAEIWRESTTEWLEHVSGVPDALGFVGSHPGRTNAGAMDLSGYELLHSDGSPHGEVSASALACGATACSASVSFRGATNVYRVEVGYFRDGPADFELRVNGVTSARWSNRLAGSGKGLLPSSAERFIANGVALKTGDKVEVYAMPHSGGRAPLQFIEITRDPRWN